MNLCYKALRMLAYLKDELKYSNPAEYEKRKPLAWAAAREALHHFETLEGGVVVVPVEDLRRVENALREVTTGHGTHWNALAKERDECYCSVCTEAREALSSLSRLQQGVKE